MKISELIEQLKSLQEKHGDIQVAKTSVSTGGAIPVTPSVTHFKLTEWGKPTGRFVTSSTAKSNYGQKVVRV